MVNDFQQGWQDHSMVKEIFSINGAGATEYLHAKELDWTPFSQYIKN